MEKITVYFSDRKYNIFSFLIKKVLGTDYSHVAIRFKNSVYHASAVGVTHLTDCKFRSQNRVVSEASIYVSTSDFNRCISYSRTMLGRAYGFLTILGTAWELLIGREVKFGDDGERSLICSEFVGKALAEINLLRNEDLDDLDPKELKDLINNLMDE